MMADIIRKVIFSSRPYIVVSINGAVRESIAIDRCDITRGGISSLAFSNIY